MTAEERAYGVRKALAFAFKTDREQIEIIADAIRAAVNAERERCLAWIDRYWSFNDCQQHTHTWHSREDCRERIRSGELP